MLTMLTIDKLIIGRAYVTHKKAPGYLFICSDNEHCISNYIERNNFNQQGHFGSKHNSSFSHYREATAIEEAHLKACIKAKQWVEAPKNLSPDYNIF